VVAAFLKNGHAYGRDYHTESNSLGRDISAWWDEISGTAHVGFGGPAGIYLMVVLMSWWCSLLKDSLDSDRVGYTVLVDKLNHAILQAIPRTDQSNAGPSSPDYSLLASSPPPSQYSSQRAKRARAEDSSSSRKRLRV
jgi:hypothetical protein